MYRDPINVLMKKQWYMKRNVNIFNRPAMHALALYIGYRAEKTSRLI